jgi:hypothetical protein
LLRVCFPDPQECRLRHAVADTTEEPELITEDATRSVVPSFGAKKPLVDAEPEKGAEAGGAAASESTEAVPEDISAFYNKIGQSFSLSVSR